MAEKNKENNKNNSDLIYNLILTHTESCSFSHTHTHTHTIASGQTAIITDLQKTMKATVTPTTRFQRAQQ